MAQNTIGVKIGYAKATKTSGTGEWAKPSSYNHIPDLTGFPSLGGSPSSIDVTTFDNIENKSYISGLNDLGGTLDFSAMLTPELMEVHTAMMSAQDETPFQLFIAIDFPAPLSKRYYWRGTVLPLAPDEGGVDAALTATLRFTALSDVDIEDLTV